MAVKSANSDYDPFVLADSVLHISRMTSILLIISYALYVYFQMRSHQSIYDAIFEADEHKQEDYEEDLLKEKNEIIGKYICQGAVDPNLIEAFKKLDSNNYHAITDEKLRRYKIAELHPNEAEILSASILFKERLTII